MSNRQAVLTEESEPLQIQNNPIPEAPPGGLVVKTHFSGICHSDVHFWENRILIADGVCVKMTDAPGIDFPIVLGHEIAGEVHSIGEDQPPDTALVIQAPADLPLDVGALLSCSGLTAYNALCYAKPYLQTADKVNGSSTLLIAGAGGLGLWAIELAKVVLRDNKTKIVVADVAEAKLETAKAAGADVTVLWDSEDPSEDIKKTQEACNTGFDAAIDFVNSSGTANRIFPCANSGAAAMLVGLFGGTFKVPLVQFPLKCISLHGVITGSLSQFRELVELVADEKVKPPPITHVTQDDATDILRKLKAATYTGRGIINYSLKPDSSL